MCGSPTSVRLEDQRYGPALRLVPGPGSAGLYGGSRAPPTPERLPLDAVTPLVIYGKAIGREGRDAGKVPGARLLEVNNTRPAHLLGSGETKDWARIRRLYSEEPDARLTRFPACTMLMQ